MPVWTFLSLVWLYEKKEFLYEEHERVTIVNETFKNLKGRFGRITTDPDCHSIIWILFQGETLDYLGIPGFHLAGSQGVIVIAICQAILMVMILNFILSSLGKSFNWYKSFVAFLIPYIQLRHLYGVPLIISNLN